MAGSRPEAERSGAARRADAAAQADPDGPGRSANRLLRRGELSLGSSACAERQEQLPQRRGARPWRRRLGELGSGGEGTDLGAHGFGFGAGVLIGLGVAAIGRQDVRPSRALQLALASATILLLSGSWALALMR